MPRDSKQQFAYEGFQPTTFSTVDNGEVPNKTSVSTKHQCFGNQTISTSYTILNIYF